MGEPRGHAAYHYRLIQCASTETREARSNAGLSKLTEGRCGLAGRSYCFYRSFFCRDGAFVAQKRLKREAEVSLFAK